MLTAVVLANGNDGDNLYPLTEDMPLAALPVGNRPLLSYQLEMLQRAGSFGEVLVVTNDRHLSRLEAVVSEYRGPLRIELVVVEEGAGSADALRTLRGRGRLAGDFALISGDTISDVPFQKIAAMHQLHGASVTVLLKQQPPRPAADKKKARDLDGTDFVGIDESRQRLLYLESAADCDGGVITVHSDLADPHVYLFAHWVLDHKPHFSSAKFELLPYLVKKSAVGPHCRLGAGVRLTNCVLMEGVVVHDKVHEGATLKDVQVGSNVSVEAGANVKSEALTAEAPLNEHEPVRDAARVMQPKVTATAEGSAAEGEAAAAAMAAGSARPPLLLVLWDVSHLPPLASDKVAGSMDADLLEIEEVLGVRYCDPSQMTAVALRNPVDEDDDRLEYLVSGSAGPDDRGFHSVDWFFHGDLLDHAGADTVKAAIQEY
ncbi:hypothetical protein EMIHUDRAFT_97762 [Emiliania huxleyi CCMP1516]|uniref:Translation initiation factor eIF2B subunit gamma n=2 Tax=Emiliania huxleyi TaxID=2903 RepID=A0A0D3KUY3_EMIH1|nr:hypothetical protein EMIHUDRAFT_97762 [Emiliania huxleyi CCMP1516]EOD39568.1 hypothetical protein EMIHUDRAFT_97762 [Emiliania huxleyi CCMP1516]|eukprot:XP_005791997.1 hypothetical protein EMIHUDRAFT_97762 [Emiliania huxleyi CCMP1516]